MPVNAVLYATLPIPVPHGVRLCRPVPRHTSKQRANTPGDDLGPSVPEPRPGASAEDHWWRLSPVAWAPCGQAVGLLCTGGVPCIDLRCTRAADDAQRHATADLADRARGATCTVAPLPGHRSGIAAQPGSASAMRRHCSSAWPPRRPGRCRRVELRVGAVECVRQDSSVSNHRCGGFEIASTQTGDGW
jgi:hypothetical protein